MEMMMSVKDAADQLKVAPSMIYDLIASGRLRCYRIGNGRGVIRISEAQIAEYLDRVETGPKERAAPSPPKPAVRPFTPTLLRRRS